jgi:hypothetical protein
MRSGTKLLGIFAIATAMGAPVAAQAQIDNAGDNGYDSFPPSVSIPADAVTGRFVGPFQCDRPYDQFIKAVSSGNFCAMPDGSGYVSDIFSRRWHLNIVYGPPAEGPKNYAQSPP